MSNVTKPEQTSVDEGKEKYQIFNWPSYNQARINRGDITIYFSEEAFENWYHLRS